MRTPTTEILQRIESKVIVEKPRTYLGASSIGKECSRALWYEFRHAGLEVFSARLHRLFERGHREEEVFIRILRESGMEVWPFDPHTGEQFGFTDFDGHFRGHKDGVGRYPGEDPVLLEFKSYNDKRFEKLKKYGVETSDPKYFSQVQVYMAGIKLKTTLFCAVNKNDDHLYFEYVEFNPIKFQGLNNKAHNILTSSVPPMRIGNEHSYDCRYCPHLEMCHHGLPALKNCRSCMFGEPSVNSTWICTKGHTFGEVCPDYSDITNQYIP